MGAVPQGKEGECSSLEWTRGVESVGEFGRTGESKCYVKHCGDVMLRSMEGRSGSFAGSSSTNCVLGGF